MHGTPRHRLSGSALTLLAASALLSGLPLSIATAQTVTHAAHSAHSADAGLKWGPAPPVFPAGARMAVLQGDPSAAGKIFTVRLEFPDGYKLAPHTHPTDENVTVMEGTFLVGLGDKFSESAMKPLAAGGFITAPAHASHYAMARGRTVVQVHAMGPFQLTYVNPKDDPTKR